MVAFARIAADTVAELFVVPDGVEIGDCFHQDLATSFVRVPAGVDPAPGWRYDGRVFSAPPAPPPVTRTPEAYGDDLITALSDAELSAMSGGTLRDQRMLSAQRVPFRAADDIIVRLASVMKIEPSAWLARVPG